MTSDSPKDGAGGNAPDSYATRVPTAPFEQRHPAEKTAADPLALVAGDRFDDFEVVSVLGRGSFGTVYSARSTWPGKPRSTGLWR